MWSTQQIHWETFFFQRSFEPSPLQVRWSVPLPWLKHSHPAERRATVLIRGVNDEWPKGHNKQETRELLQGSWAARKHHFPCHLLFHCSLQHFWSRSAHSKPTGQVYLAVTSKIIPYYVINDISRTLNNLYQVSLVLPNAKTSEGTIPGKEIITA